MTAPRPLAVQLYTFRDRSRSGPDAMTLDPATLDALAGIGLVGVETVDVPGGDPVAARRALADAGLEIASSHSWTRPSDRDAVARAASALAELGSRTMIVSGPGFASVAEADRYIDDVNGAAVIAAEHGLRFGYHNHSAEFLALDGTTAWQRMLDRLDPQVRLQVDIFWVAVGGADPATVITVVGDRVISLHLKDGASLPGSTEEPHVNVPVGQGVVDIAAAVRAADALPGVEWGIVEFDECDGPPLDAVRASVDWLAGAGLGRARA